MRLATPTAVLNVLGIQTGEGALLTAAGALDATFPSVEAMVESILLRGTRIDSFDFGKYDTEAPVLRLHSGFLTKDEPVAVSAYGTAVSADAYRVNYDIGTVELFLTYPSGARAVSVTYTHGFEKDLEDETQFQNLPEALTQGGLLMAAMFIMLNPANVAKEKARFLAGVTVSGLEYQAKNALVRYARPRGTVVWPSYTEVVE